MYQHIADALSRPSLVRVSEGLLCLRFETMKVISAMGAVRHLLDRGVVRPGDTLVDSSSGIYAYALALACHRFGMGCHIIGSTTVDQALRTQLDILGVTLEQVRPSADLKLDQRLRVRRIQEVLRENPSYHWMRQYHDDVHYLGYHEVADLVVSETGPRDLTIVGGVGSGASTGALARYLRRRLPSVELAGVQPFGSLTFGAEHVPDPEIIIAGIGSSIPFANVMHELYDTVHWISFEAALSGSVDLLRRHAIFAGLSSGAAYLAARWQRRRDPARTFLFIAADTGHRYVDSVFQRHREARDVDQYAPVEVSHVAELTLPWSWTRWNGAPGPAEAQVS